MMIAPSWFWKKNLNVSDARAGSCLLAAFHSKLPAIAKIAIPSQNADQQRQVSVVELVLVEQDNPGDLAANGNDPRERGEKAEARGSGLLALCCLPILGNVCGRLLVGHDQVPRYRHSCGAASNRKANPPGAASLNELSSSPALATRRMLAPRRPYPQFIDHISHSYCARVNASIPRGRTPVRRWLCSSSSAART